jgi:hypothetical protein
MSDRLTWTPTGDPDADRVRQRAMEIRVRSYCRRVRR